MNIPAGSDSLAVGSQGFSDELSYTALVMAYCREMCVISVYMLFSDI